MPSPRLVALVTILMLAASGSATMSQDELDLLRRLESLIAERDCDGLVAFLRRNPSLMAGDDALARELQGFMANALSGNLDCFAAIAAVESSGESDGIY
ncbi:MAG: hypothetical protein N2422_06570 [Rhodobacteraceae bacterium]|nr:hypothetical protein [Paracoccaceae bacterium]